MADVAASANDPIFLNHHAMVDCIFETWLRKNPSAQYPQNNEIHQGHRQQDYIVPFFPLYTHQEMFSTADTFGYHCTIKSIHAKLSGGAIAGIVVAVVVVVLIAVICGCCYYCYKQQSTPYLILIEFVDMYRNSGN